MVTELLPQVSLDMTSGALAPERLFARPIAELRVEIGFGDGARLIALAADHDKTGFIGCEPFVNGVAKALAGISERKLENIRLHSGDGRDVLEALPATSVNLIEVLYPDPWPKRRHNKRRIVSDEFLSACARVLLPGGKLRFATDIDDYCGWTLARILRSPDFTWTAEGPVEWLKPWEGWVPTRYEQKARQEGRTSVYLTFIRN